MKSQNLLRLLAFYLILCNNSAVIGEDLKLKNGVVLKNYSVHKVTPTGLVIFHETGGMTAGPDLLPDSVVKKYGLDAEKIRRAKASAKAEQQDNARLQRLKNKVQSNALVASGKVLQVAPGGGGALVEQVSFSKKVRKTVRIGNSVNIKDSLEFVTYKKLIFIECDTSNLADGSDLQMIVWADGNYQYENGLGQARTVEKYTADLEKVVKRTKIQAK